MRLIDYVFFRVYRFYKTKKDAIPTFMGCGVITVALFFSLLTLLVILNLVFKAKLELLINKPLALLIMAVTLGLLNWRYNNQQLIESLEEKYSEEGPPKRRRNAFYIFMYIVFVLFTPIIYSFLKHNLHYDI